MDMEGSVESRLEDARKLHKDLCETEHQIDKKLEKTKRDSDWLDRQLNAQYKENHYGYRDWVSSARSHIRGYEEALLDIHGLKYRRGESKGLHSVVDERMASLYKGLNHGCKKRVEEKRLLKDMKQVEKNKRNLVNNAAKVMANDRYPTPKSVESIVDHIEAYYGHVDRLLSEDLVDRAKRKVRWKKLEEFNAEINRIEIELTDIRKQKCDVKTLILALTK